MKKTKDLSEVKNLIESVEQTEQTSESKTKKQKLMKEKTAKATAKEKITEELTKDLIIKDQKVIYPETVTLFGKVIPNNTGLGHCFVPDSFNNTIFIPDIFFRKYKFPANGEVVTNVTTYKGEINGKCRINSFELPEIVLNNVEGVIHYSGLEAEVVGNNVHINLVTEVEVKELPGIIFPVNPYCVPETNQCNVEKGPRKVIVSVKDGVITNLYFKYPNENALAYTFRIEEDDKVVFQSSATVNTSGLDVDYQVLMFNTIVGTDERKVPNRLVSNNDPMCLNKVTVLVCSIPSKTGNTFSLSLNSPDDYIEEIKNALKERKEMIKQKTS